MSTATAKITPNVIAEHGLTAEEYALVLEIMGREPTHFDSHHHSHRLPAVFEALVTLAWETGLPVRNPSEEAARTLRRHRRPLAGPARGEGARR